MIRSVFNHHEIDGWQMDGYRLEPLPSLSDYSVILLSFYIDFSNFISSLL